MKFYEFGSRNNRPLMLIHGMATTWEMNFKEIMLDLEKNFYIIVAALDGHNPEEHSEFRTFVEEASNIENYLIENFDGKIDAIFGSSMGGTITLQIIANNRIKIRKAIIDGAYATNYGFLTKVATRVMTSIFVKIVSSKPSTILKIMGLSENSDLSDKIYSKISKDSIWNCFYESYNYKLPKGLDCSNTKVAFWYGSKEKMPPKLANKIKAQLPSMDIRIFDNYGHGEYTTKHPEEIIKEFNNI